MLATYSPADIADALVDGLLQHTAALDLEQAVRGLDSLEELDLHPLLADALVAAGWGVHREQRYPADRKKRKRTEGERCDLVLTPGSAPLRDPSAASTLFDDPKATDLDEAVWLEVKVVGQFTDEGANRTYTSQLLSTVRQDVTKLSKDPGILRAALLIVLFVADDTVADHDLGVWQDRCLEKGLPIGAPSRRSFAISNRLGNGICALAVYPVNHL